MNDLPNRIYVVAISDEPLDMTPEQAEAAEANRQQWLAAKHDDYEPGMPYGLDEDDSAWPRHDFFFPPGKVYRSRSGAKARADLIESYGGKAVIYECDPQWVPVEVAKARRDSERLAARVAKLRAEADALEAGGAA